MLFFISIHTSSCHMADTGLRIEKGWMRNFKSTCGLMQLSFSHDLILRLSLYRFNRYKQI